MLVFIFVCIMARFSVSDFKSSIKSSLGLNEELFFSQSLGCATVSGDYAQIKSVIRKGNGWINVADIWGNEYEPSEFSGLDLQAILEAIDVLFEKIQNYR